MSLNFAMYLLEQGAISDEQLTRALRDSLASQTSLGELAMREGKMTMKQVYEVLRFQAGRSASFGEIARHCGFLGRADLADLLYVQSEEQLSVIDALLLQQAISPDVVERYRSEYQTVKLQENRRMTLGEAFGRQSPGSASRFAIWESRS